VAGKIDAFLKLSVVAAVLLASSSVAYYYVVYLPERDARIDADKAATEQRRAAGKAATEQNRSEEQLSAKLRYDRCLREAQDIYNSDWASNCGLRRQEAAQIAQKHARCVADPANDKNLCDQHYTVPDASPNCALPRVLATDLEARLNKARQLCLQASKAGL
jgi:hypothetical protein